MDISEIEKKINKLFLEKKYDDLIKLSEEFTIANNRPASMANIIGISKILKKNRTEKDVSSSLELFNETFIIGNQSIHSLNGLIHLISISIQFAPKYKYLSKFLHLAKKYYLNSEKNFDNNENFLTSGIDLFSYLLNFEERQRTYKKLISLGKLSKYSISSYLFNNNYLPDFHQKKHNETAKSYSIYFPKLKVKDLVKKNFDLKNKIEIGFVSKDYEKNHSIIFFIKDIIKKINRKKFKVYLFSFSKKDLEDESQNELRNLADVWCDLENFSNQKSAAIIQQNKIKILIDLMGFTAPGRIELFNSRISQIQISMIGYCNTLGFDTPNFLIADKNLILENEEKNYSENIIKLPNIWNAHSGFNYERKFNKLPSVDYKYFTYGSLNNFKKISDEVINTWSKILQKNFTSRLLLKSSEYCDNEYLLSKFKENKVSKQIEILDKGDFKNKKDHLKLYNKIDLALDTFPYNGVTTTFEALWMNVPVLVLKGYNFNSRCGESIIANSGINYLIAENQKEYIKKAYHLSQNKEKLNEMRNKLYKNILLTPLFDTTKYTQELSKSLIELMNHNS
tara:strand:- start:745 stop:2442 length:1698 start_codon:yes stop_codon:yes gene_type:complete